MKAVLERPLIFALLVYSSLRTPVSKYLWATPAFTRTHTPHACTYKHEHYRQLLTPGRRHGAARWRTAEIKMWWLKASFTRLCPRHGRGLDRPGTTGDASPDSPRSVHAPEPHGRLATIPQPTPALVLQTSPERAKKTSNRLARHVEHSTPAGLPGPRPLNSRRPRWDELAEEGGGGGRPSSQRGQRSPCCRRSYREMCALTRWNWRTSAGAPRPPAPRLLPPGLPQGGCGGRHILGREELPPPSPRAPLPGQGAAPAAAGGAWGARRRQRPPASRLRPSGEASKRARRGGSSCF